MILLRSSLAACGGLYQEPDLMIPTNVTSSMKLFLLPEGKNFALLISVAFSSLLNGEPSHIPYRLPQEIKELVHLVLTVSIQQILAILIPVFIFVLCYSVLSLLECMAQCNMQQLIDCTSSTSVIGSGKWIFSFMCPRYTWKFLIYSRYSI